MGVSTDAILAYGFSLPYGEEQEHVAPWETDEFEGDPGEWWLKVSGFDDSDSPWDANGERRSGTTKEDLRRWYERKTAWRKEHPMPVEIVPHCHCDHSMWLATIPGTVTRAYRGEVERPKLEKPSEAAVTRAIEWLSRHLPHTDVSSCGWLLVSYADF